jgi:hypothetical protein
MKKTLVLYFSSFNRRKRIIFALASLLIGFFASLGYLMSFYDDVYLIPKFIYIPHVDAGVVISFIINTISFALIALLVIIVVDFISLRIRDHKEKEVEERAPKKFFWIAAGVLGLAWMPYYLSTYPGGLFYDTFESAWMAQTMDDYGIRFLNSHYPVVDALFLRGIYLFNTEYFPSLKETFIKEGMIDRVVLNSHWSMTDEMIYAMITAGIVEYIAMVLVMAYVVHWMRKMGLKRWLSYIVLAFIAIFPLFPLYAVSVWKDTPFNLALIVFVLTLAEFIFSKGELLKDRKYFRKFILLSILLAILRNNGIYILAVVFAIMAIYLFVKDHAAMFKKYAKFFILTPMIIVSVLILHGPVYDRLGFNAKYNTGEMLGIPVRQLAYISFYDYELPEEDQAYLDSIMGKNFVKEFYAPMIADTIKFNNPNLIEGGFDNKVIENDKLKFAMFYLKLWTMHPKAMIKAYIMATAGFYSPRINNGFGYAQIKPWDDPDFGVYRYDLFEKMFGFSIYEKIENMAPISAAYFLFTMIITAAILWVRKSYTKLIVLIPGFVTWLTVMIATPVTISLRYVYILVLMVPVEIYLLTTKRISLKKSED